MSVIWTPGKRYTQPQGRVEVDDSIWPGRHQIILPSMGVGGILGGVETFTATAPNQPFTLVRDVGRVHTWRPNTSTQVGETADWNAGDFNIGPNGSMIAVAAYDSGSFWGGLNYGGSLWGLWLGFGLNSAVARYVDFPTTAAFTATVSVASTARIYHPIGLVKSGTTVKVFFKGRTASATGGNGGVRRSAGSGLTGPSGSIDGRQFYSSIALGGVCTEALSDDAMFSLLENPWQIFKPATSRVIFLPVAAGAPTLSAVSAQSITSSSIVPRVTVTF